VEIRKILFRGHPGKTVRDPISTNKKVGAVVFASHPSYAGSINRIVVQAGLDINVRPYFKKMKAKRVGGHGLSGRAPV
jgi:hypothetical protein